MLSYLASSWLNERPITDSSVSSGKGWMGHKSSFHLKLRRIFHTIEGTGDIEISIWMITNEVR